MDCLLKKGYSWYKFMVHYTTYAITNKKPLNKIEKQKIH